MARRKQTTPLQRQPSDFSKGPPESPDQGWERLAQNGHLSNSKSNGVLEKTEKALSSPRPDNPSPLHVTEQAGLIQLVVCVAGIYASFLSWAILQERIFTTSYGAQSSSASKFEYSVFLNTIQSSFAALSGYLYLLTSNRSSKHTPAIFPSSRILLPLLLVAITSSLASPFGYASLAHIDYITYIPTKPSTKPNHPSARLHPNTHLNPRHRLLPFPPHPPNTLPLPPLHRLLPLAEQQLHNRPIHPKPKIPLHSPTSLIL